MTKTLDPDELAELERERRFLLTSLDDLDAEYEAGDLEQYDYEMLTDDYTRRVAEVVRSIAQRRSAFAAVDNKLSSRQRVITIVAVTIVAILAGVLLARASGFRSPNDTVSGDIRRSSVSLLNEADTLTREGLWPEAIDVYDEVLDLTPANVEALTYRGWLTAQLGNPDQGLLDLGEAIAVDPTYPDARVFSAILLDREQRFEDAAGHLAVLGGLDAPGEIVGLVDASGLRASVAAGQIAERFGAGDPIDLDQIQAPIADVASAAVVLDSLDPVLAFRVFDAVLAEDPDQMTALLGKGRRLGADPDIFAGSPDVAAEGLALLDRAVELAPASSEVRLYRALARAVQTDAEGAAADLALVNRVELSEELGALFDQIEAGLG